jgi:hypothetical protein
MEVDDAQALLEVAIAEVCELTEAGPPMDMLGTAARSPEGETVVAVALIADKTKTLGAVPLV